MKGFANGSLLEPISDIPKMISTWLKIASKILGNSAGDPANRRYNIKGMQITEQNFNTVAYRAPLMSGPGRSRGEIKNIQAALYFSE